METVEIEERSHGSFQGETPVQRDLSHLLELRGKERMEAILSSDRPEELFQSLPEQEAYFTIKEIGEQDALPLLALMSSDQCQYLIDLELWKGYEFQPKKMEQWLPLLLSCGEESVDRWLRSVDIDTLLLILKKTIRVHLSGEEESPLARQEENRRFTLDGTYFIEVLDPSLETWIEQLLRHLAHQDLHFYWKILHQVDSEIGAELEERALHFREARLEDKGFPPMDEALAIYQYLNPNRLKKWLERKEIHLPDVPENTPLPSFPMILKDQDLFFSLCLREMGDRTVIDRLKMELAYMANQVTVADQPDHVDFHVIQGSLRKVGGYLSIGLELLSEGSIQKAKEWVEQIPLKFIFQVGFGASLELKWRAERIWKNFFSGRSIPLSFLGSPWEEKMEGLLRKRPLYYDSEMGYREFRSLHEIWSLHRDLDAIEVVGKIISSLPSFSYSEGLQWKAMLLTAYADERSEGPLGEGLRSWKETSSDMGAFCQERVERDESLADWLLQKLGCHAERETNLVKELAKSILEDTVI